MRKIRLICRGESDFSGVKSPDSILPDAAEALSRLLREKSEDITLNCPAEEIRLVLSELLGLPRECFLQLKPEYVISQSEAFSRVEDEAETQAPAASALWQWKPDMIRFLEDASLYGSYDRELAAALLPYLSKTDTLCDMGCGLGYLDMALAPFTADITAVDINLNALSALRKNCAAAKIGNIHPLCADAASLPQDMKFDDMVFCFYGDLSDILSIAKTHCRKNLFIIRRNYGSHRFSVGKHALPGDDCGGTCKALGALCIPCSCEMLSLEHGQPFRSLEDARCFYRLYSKDENAEELTDTFLQTRLQRTDDSVFPFYLPQKRDVGVIRIEVKNL